MKLPRTYRRFCCLLALLLIGFIYTAAQQPTRSKREVPAAASAPAEVLLDSAASFLDSDLPATFNYVERALESSITSGDRAGEARSYLLLARTHLNLEQYDLAANYYEKALKFQGYLTRNEMTALHRGLAESLEARNQADRAVEELQLALSYALESGNVQEQINIRYDLARLYVSTGKSQAALQEYEIISGLESSRQNPRGVATANNFKGEVYLKENQPEAALSNYQEAERIADETSDVELKSEALRKRGKAYRQVQQYDEELAVRQQSLEISMERNEPAAAAEDNLMIGEIYLETQKPEEAVPYIERSVELSEQSGDYEKRGVALKKLSEAYGQQGAFDKALVTYQAYAENIDSLYARRERQLQQNLELVASVSRKLQRIDLLEQDYEITRKSLALLEKEQMVSARELRIQKYISYGLVVLALGLTLATFLIYRSSLQKRKANMLLALRSLRSQMNPHFIFNSLNSVNAFIASNDERKANKYLSDFSKLMRLVLENSKHDFVPVGSELDVIELYLKLEHSRFAEKFDYLLDVDPHIKQSEHQIPPMLIQPYIENAIWHGLRYKEEKGSLEVKLKLEDDQLIATITDNGIGRKRSAELKTRHQQMNTATGMKNTRTRLDIINEVYAMNYRVAVNDVNQEDGTGTIVRLQIPLALNPFEED